MDRLEYEKLDIAEDRMWWFAALHRNLLAIANSALTGARDLPILDAGCGTGGFLARLGQQYRERAVFGLELDHSACIRAAAKSGQTVCVGSVNNMPFRDSSFAVIFSADVLCHCGADQSRALQQFHRCLVEDGYLILNLPAYRWMLSRHDTAVHNIRRYTASGLSRLLQTVGFHPVYVSYWNAMMFPLMVMTRKLLVDCRTRSDVKPYPPPIDRLCGWVTGFETGLLRRGLRFPFGGSVIAIAAKRAAAHA